MSERQAKRLRRAQRAYIRTNKTSLDRGPKAHEAADARAAIVRQLWPRLNHRMRGVVGGLLAGGIVRTVDSDCYGVMYICRYVWSNLNGALRALGVAVPS